MFWGIHITDPAWVSHYPHDPFLISSLSLLFTVHLVHDAQSPRKYVLKGTFIMFLSLRKLVTCPQAHVAPVPQGFFTAHLSFFKTRFFFLLIFRERTERERQGGKHQCVFPLSHPLLGTWSAMQACVLVGNSIQNKIRHSWDLNVTFAHSHEPYVCNYKTRDMKRKKDITKLFALI